MSSKMDKEKKFSYWSLESWKKVVETGFHGDSSEQ